jgi:hypothetical protein
MYHIIYSHNKAMKSATPTCPSMDGLMDGLMDELMGAFI